jgi:outer membrane receptor protein involved in Fe transport
VYTVPRGIFKGLKLGGTANVAWGIADYYYYPTGYSPTATRTLLYRPTKALFNAIIGYERKFKKVTWSTQVNVDNVLNNYSVFIRPNKISGYGGINQAIWTNQPREWTWSSTVKF